jgi:hypothetical protein
MMDNIVKIVQLLGKKAEINLLPLQLSDVTGTYANVDALSRAI